MDINTFLMASETSTHPVWDFLWGAFKTHPVVISAVTASPAFALKRVQKATRWAVVRILKLVARMFNGVLDEANSVRHEINCDFVSHIQIVSDLLVEVRMHAQSDRAVLYMFKNGSSFLSGESIRKMDSYMESVKQGVAKTAETTFPMADRPELVAMHFDKNRSFAGVEFETASNDDSNNRECSSSSFDPIRYTTRNMAVSNRVRGDLLNSGTEVAVTFPIIRPGRKDLVGLVALHYMHEDVPPIHVSALENILGCVEQLSSNITKLNKNNEAKTNH